MIARRLGIPCVSSIDIGDGLFLTIDDGDDLVIRSRGEVGSVEVLGKTLVVPEGYKETKYFTMEELQTMEGTQEIIDFMEKEKKAKNMTFQKPSWE